MMGLEEHLITMFRGDFEFHEDAAPSHLGGHANKAPAASTPASEALDATDDDVAVLEDPVSATSAAWTAEAEKELRKIPFFVRGKARRNTERYALEHRMPVITLETLYDAKAHYSR
jgi:light-independent protochlorophyllide reductase subunit B